MSLRLREKFGNFRENSGFFWKRTTERDATVVSCHAMVLTRYACFAMIGWFIIFSNLIGWRQTFHFFLFFNVDACIVAIVKVSSETIKLIINWTIRWIIYGFDQQWLWYVCRLRDMVFSWRFGVSHSSEQSAATRPWDWHLWFSNKIVYLNPHTWKYPS